MLGSIIALLHSGQTAHEGSINPVALTVTGYTIFIMFRGIVNRAEGTLHGNLPLLYHSMVTVFDIALARALLEAAGTFLAFTILLSLIIVIGFAEFSGASANVTCRYRLYFLLFLRDFDDHRWGHS